MYIWAHRRPIQGKFLHFFYMLVYFVLNLLYCFVLIGSRRRKPINWLQCWQSTSQNVNIFWTGQSNTYYDIITSGHLVYQHTLRILVILLNLVKKVHVQFWILYRKADFCVIMVQIKEFCAPARFEERQKLYVTGQGIKLSLLPTYVMICRLSIQSIIKYN